MSKSFVRNSLLSVIVTSALLLNCSQSPQPGGPTGIMTNASDCLTLLDSRLVPDTDDCFVFSYDGQGTLLVTHLNAGFNCCPIISAEISVNDDLILIEEIENLDLGGCSCLCLFNVEYEISDLPPGEYTLKILGKYLVPAGEPLQALIDLGSTPVDTVCVFRGYYPWNQPPD